MSSISSEEMRHDNGQKGSTAHWRMTEVKKQSATILCLGSGQVDGVVRYAIQLQGFNVAVLLLCCATLAQHSAHAIDKLQSSKMLCPLLQ